MRQFYVCAIYVCSCVFVCCLCVWQSSDVSPCSVLTDEDDITDLSTDPAHYQLLSQLGRDRAIHYTVYDIYISVSYSLKFHVNIVKLREVSLCIVFCVCCLCVWVFLCMCAGRGFNNLSQVSMARHTPSGRLVAVKNTNLDECTEDELLQLMVCTCIYFTSNTSLAYEIVTLKKKNQID